VETLQVREVPLPAAGPEGKGEQNAVKIKLAIAAAQECLLFLIEEPQNHLSHSNLNNVEVISSMH